MPTTLGVRINGRAHMIEGLQAQPRPDVLKHLQLPHAMFGYQATLAVPGITGPWDVEPGFCAFVPAMGNLRLARRVVELLARNGERDGAK